MGHPEYAGGPAGGLLYDSKSPGLVVQDYERIPALCFIRTVFIIEYYDHKLCVDRAIMDVVLCVMDWMEDDSYGE